MPPDEEDLEDISPHIRIRIEPQKKKEWLKYAEKHHHGNLTGLIKHAVDNTIDDTWVLKDKHHSGAETDTSELEEGVTEVTDRLSVIEQKLDELALHSSEEPESELNRDEVMKLAHRCHDLLPHLQSEIQFPSLQEGFSVQLREVPDDFLEPGHSESGENTLARIRAKITGRAEDLADALDKPTHQVRQALIFLEQAETGSLVESTIDDGERRWFVRDPDTVPDFDFLEQHQSDQQSDEQIDH
ncbi:hypothetical protein JCM18237_17030 [Halorubrum luteum]